MAHRNLFEIILKNTDKFPLNFVNYPDGKNIRKIQECRRYLIEKGDITLIEAYRRHVGTVHQCQMPWIVGFGLNGGRPHIIPDGRTIWQFINDEVGELTENKSIEWVGKALNAVLKLIPEYIRGSYTMKVIAEQGDILNLCGGVMVSRTGYNPVHAFLLMLAGLGFTGNTYNSPGIDTGDFSERVKKLYLPSGINLDEYTLLLRNTGGEATFLGMKTAKEFTGRNHRIGYAGSYHGRFEFVDVNYFEHVIKFPDVLTGVSEDDSIQQLKEVLSKDGHNISSLIMEA
ncbi:hypothetical protein FJZ33_10960, partial [Candidatus Poribacteria bacterium]|nr:hypothetical protein [Candidatus Poribacteria bacterium]